MTPIVRPRAPAVRAALRDRVDERRRARRSRAPRRARRTTSRSRPGSPCRRRGARTNAATPTGTLTKKIHDQLSASVRTPPSRTPAAAPKPPTAPQTPSAMLRSRPSENVVVRIDSAAGEMTAAPSPWSERAAISDAFRPREAGQQRREREHDDADEEQPPPSEQIGRAPAQEQEAAEEERVGADHPLEVLLREPEVDFDRGQRHVHDRDVQDDHELHRAQQRECQPFPPFRSPP